MKYIIELVSFLLLYGTLMFGMPFIISYYRYKKFKKNHDVIGMKEEKGIVLWLVVVFMIMCFVVVLCCVGVW